MRRVVIQGTPPQDWVDDAAVVTAALRSAATAAERGLIIKKNEKLWKDDRIRNWLLQQFANKCWYTEASDAAASVHVDHFRPKGRAKEWDGSTREGYWWLAFKWTNYRISGQLINVSKADFFPLIGSICATCDDAESLALEAPWLIDPITDQARLVSYEKEDDGCVAVASGGVDETEREQVRRTIEILDLNNRDRLTQKRTDYWDRCLQAIADYRGAKGPQAVKLVLQASALLRIKEMVAYAAEFSSVAEACVRKKAPEALAAQVASSGPG